eukprot:TRINITY_DN11880_c0_g1_i1.p1 TRINITY_DN11880_c0_g1~~TRINITY_DN11880_c0_g1_i1.p1  ORF type:complete len:833 (+),score=78.60 TRINITY_DN11880_c0_g1_i1:79-2499(+)
MWCRSTRVPQTCSRWMSSGLCAFCMSSVIDAACEPAQLNSAVINRPATYAGCQAEKCIDGSMTGTSGSCAPADDMCHSAKAADVWLRVGLTASRSVCRVVVWNRPRYEERLGVHELWLGDNESFPAADGNSKVAGSKDTKQPRELEYKVRNRSGKYVFLFLPGPGVRILNIQELQVFLLPSAAPTASPTFPSASPSTSPSASPSTSPSASPSTSPSAEPSEAPTVSPSHIPTVAPTVSPSHVPTEVPSGVPSARPTPAPSSSPSARPTASPRLPAQPPLDSAAGEAAKDVTSAAVFLASPSAGQLALIGSAQCAALFRPENDTQDPLPLSLHPLRFSVASSRELGCLLGNTAVLAAVFSLNFAALVFLRRLDESGDGMLSADEVPGWAYKLLRRDLEAGPQDIKALVRFPGGTLLAFLVLHQGVAYSALRLAFHTAPLDTARLNDVVSGVVGIAAALLLMAAGATLVGVVHTGLNATVAEGTGFAHVRDWPDRPVGAVLHRRPGFLTRLLLWGNGEWVSRTREMHWAVRYQSVVRQYSTRGAAPGLAAELTAQWGQALAAALPNTTWRQCGHARVASLLVLLAHMTWLLGSRPFRRNCDWVLAPIFLGLEAAVSAVQAWTFYSYLMRSERCRAVCESAVGGMLAAASAVMLLRLLLMHAGTATLLLSGRRSQLQRLEWDDTDRRARGAPVSSTSLIAPPAGGKAQRPQRHLGPSASPGQSLLPLPSFSSGAEAQGLPQRAGPLLHSVPPRSAGAAAAPGGRPSSTTHRAAGGVLGPRQRVSPPAPGSQRRAHRACKAAGSISMYKL